MRATQRVSREPQRVPCEGMDGKFTSPEGAVIFILKRSLVGGRLYGGAPCKCKADRLSGEPNESVSTRSLISLSARAHEKSTHQPKAIRRMPNHLRTDRATPAVNRGWSPKDTGLGVSV